MVSKSIMETSRDSVGLARSGFAISIVTPSYNQREFIGEAIESVQRQGDRSCEHLIVDGLSTDGTVELLKRLKVSNPNTEVRWSSERDNGQSSALNKGFSLASGEIIG